MKKYIYKYSFGGLILLLSLSSCCLNPYGSKQRVKNSRDINNESVILTRSEKKPSRRSRRLFARRSQSKKDTQKVQANFKKYEDQLSDQDKRDISFVVSAAAEKSSISLAMSQSEIKSALNRIRELHPLALMKLLAENPSLIEGMKKMQGRDWIWNMFMSELSDVFSQAASQGVITEEDISAFASTLGLDSGTVASIVQGERWPELVDIVISQPS
ncbi:MULTISPECIES: hypothetical protein [Chlamydia]|uniref:Lipoprotein n=1 Tax=Chlamydophila parapsittaci TaxID=344886 RepID=A0ABX5VXB3_9CHLA|nr:MULTISPECIES: hypothetical protein [Chlamydia]EPL02038.1 putative lipoprotein [Chlamydia psittaci 09DC79]EPP29589.1 putative lipoprotein [Chlamydia psittaci 08-2626_L3]KPZ36950.1 hypothetical protein GWK_01415 [Chlamydia psittaci CP3]KPZ38948.1 hypothetical protein GWI_01400 [Chlamydia psittaci str. Frances]MBE3636461.1 hypothetical protein [Chlamydia psittaci]